jgi:N-acetylglucosamine kinase-like BadF-type ATPase
MIVLGADLGGTSLRVVLYEDGVAQGEAAGSGGPMRIGKGSEIASNLAGLARPLLLRSRTSRADVLVVGAAGAGREAERTELKESLNAERISWQVVVTSDAELARAAAFEGGPGVLLIAGTGSIAIAVDAAGKVRRAGGLGWRMGDEGSGYWVGQQALRAVGAMHDGLGPATHLAESLSAQTGTPGIAALIRWSTTATVASVAALAPAVLSAADRGDQVADKIASSAADLLVDLATSAGASHLPVALSGGLLASGRPLAERVSDRLKARHDIEVTGRTADPCSGAVFLAKQIR